MTALYPKYQRMTAIGPKPVGRSPLEDAELWTVLQVLDDPERIFDELAQHVISPKQVVALKTCHPDLYGYIREQTDLALQEHAARHPKWEPTPAQTELVNVLAEIMKPVAPPAPPAPPQKVDGIDLDDRATDEKSAGQITGEPKAA
jgi:hypothetical protein